MNHDQAVTALTELTGWRKSRASQAQNDCVEVNTALAGRVGVRDSKLGAASPILTVPPTAFAALIAVSAGRR